MCGILCYQNKPGVNDLSKHLHLQRNRGEDGFGAIHLETGRVVRALDKAAFLKKFHNRMPRKGSIIVHHRKASLGGITEALVHPLKATNEPLYVMQNGTKRDLLAAFDCYASDTAMIAELLPQLDDKARKAMLDGCGVVFMLNTELKKLWLSHDGKRTLHYCTEGEHKGMFSSFPLGAGEWRKCPPLVGTPSMPLDTTKWEEYLPLHEPVAFKVNPRYRDRDDDYLHQWYAPKKKGGKKKGQEYGVKTFGGGPQDYGDYGEPSHEPPTVVKVVATPFVAVSTPPKVTATVAPTPSTTRGCESLSTRRSWPESPNQAPRNQPALMCSEGCVDGSGDSQYDEDYGNAASVSGFDSFMDEQGNEVFPCDACRTFDCRTCSKFNY